MTRSILFTSALFGAEALTGRQSDLMVGKSQQFSVRNAIEHLLNEFTKESDHNQKAMKKLEKEEHDRTCKLDEKIEKAEAALAEATTQLDDANARIAADKGIVGKVSSEIEKTERQIDQETETLETTSATWRDANNKFDEMYTELVEDTWPALTEAITAISEYSGDTKSARAQNIDSASKDGTQKKALQAESAEDGFIAKLNQHLQELGDAAEKALDYARDIPNTKFAALIRKDGVVQTKDSSVGSPATQSAALIARFAPVADGFAKVHDLHEKVSFLQMSGRGGTTFEGGGAQRAFGIIEGLITKGGQDMRVEMDQFVSVTNNLRDIHGLSEKTLGEQHVMLSEFKQELGQAQKSLEIEKENADDGTALLQLNEDPTLAGEIEIKKKERAEYAKNANLMLTALRNEGASLTRIVEVVKNYQAESYHADNAQVLLQLAEEKAHICDKMAVEVKRTFDSVYREQLADYKDQQNVAARTAELKASLAAMETNQQTIAGKTETMKGKLAAAKDTESMAAERKQGAEADLAVAQRDNADATKNFDLWLEDAKVLTQGIKEIRAIWEDQQANVQATAEEHHTETPRDAIHILDGYAKMLGEKMIIEAVNLAGNQKTTQEQVLISHATIEATTKAVASSLDEQVQHEKSLTALLKTHNNAAATRQTITEAIAAQNGDVEHWQQNAGPRAAAERTASLKTGVDGISKLGTFPSCQDKGNVVLEALAHSPHDDCYSCCDLKVNGVDGTLKCDDISGRPSAGLAYVTCGTCLARGRDFSVEDMIDVCENSESAVYAQSEGCKNLPTRNVPAANAAVTGP